VCSSFGALRAGSWASATMQYKQDRPSPLAQRPLRSGQMVNCLRQHFIYSEKRARDFLFSAVENVLRSTAEPLILSRLTRTTTVRAQQDAVISGFEFSNWDAAGNAVIQAMLNAEVLLTHDGSPVPIGIAAQATPVADLKQGYQDLTEAYLVEFLIRKLGDVTTRDHRAVAHALFRQFDPRISMDFFEDRVAMLMATLADRVTLNEVGAYSVRTKQNFALYSNA
jgi:hypothetical protein